MLLLEGDICDLCIINTGAIEWRQGIRDISGDICDLCIINTGAIEWRQGIRDISGGYM